MRQVLVLWASQSSYHGPRHASRGSRSDLSAPVRHDATTPFPADLPFRHRQLGDHPTGTFSDSSTPTTAGSVQHLVAAQQRASPRRSRLRMLALGSSELRPSPASACTTTASRSGRGTARRAVDSEPGEDELARASIRWSLGARWRAGPPSPPRSPRRRQVPAPGRPRSTPAMRGASGTGPVAAGSSKEVRENLLDVADSPRAFARPRKTRSPRAHQRDAPRRRVVRRRRWDPTRRGRRRRAPVAAARRADQRARRQPGRTDLLALRRRAVGRRGLRQRCARTTAATSPVDMVPAGGGRVAELAPDLPAADLVRVLAPPRAAAVLDLVERARVAATRSR